MKIIEPKNKILIITIITVALITSLGGTYLFIKSHKTNGSDKDKQTTKISDSEKNRNIIEEVEMRQIDEDDNIKEIETYPDEEDSKDKQTLNNNNNNNNNPKSENQNVLEKPIKTEKKSYASSSQSENTIKQTNEEQTANNKEATKTDIPQQNLNDIKFLEPYTNKELGFSISFPDFWKDKYIIKEEEEGIYVYYKSAQEILPGEGLLFEIIRLTPSSEEFLDFIGNKRYFSAKGVTYVIGGTTGLSYPPDYSDFSSFKQLSESRAIALSTLKPTSI